MIDAGEAADIFRQAAQLNLEDPLRRGSLLEFPNYGQLVMTGDLHGHRRNFDKLQRYCDLERAGARHVVLHEIIHIDVEGNGGRDDSHLVLLDAARWKVDFPDQVHFLQSNHELAQLSRHEITKNGRVVTLDFSQDVERTYGSGAGPVLEGIDDYLRSLPLAGRTANRVFLSHSLPTPHSLPMFDPQVVHRLPTAEDLENYGSGYLLVWGRYQTEHELQALASVYDVDCFICGHQPQESGYEVVHDRMIILASDHNHGVFLAFDLGKPTSVEQLTSQIRPLAALM
jgi:hypothetical protein